MRKKVIEKPSNNNTHPDKAHFRDLIQRQKDPQKRQELIEEETAHNHPNRQRHRHE